MSNFGIARSEMKSSLDISIIEKSPVIQKPTWIGRYQLEYGHV